MKRSDRRWLWLMASGLLAASIILYAVQLAVFRDGRDTLFYLLQDLAFLPLTLLVAGLVVERLISLREKRTIVHRMNMVVGAFFSELGTPLLAELLPAMSSAEEIRERLHLQAAWTREDFRDAFKFARTLKCDIDLSRIDREGLRAHLIEQRPFMLRLLENPNLMEHERFTDLLWAVLHLEEELEARVSLADLLPADEAHLEVDARRAYNALLAEWVLYVEHLNTDYPYLFSLIVRTHPFQDAPSAVFKE